MRKIYFAFALLLSLMGVTQMKAQETLTVYDKTSTNQYIPIYGYYADSNGCQSEFIIPAADLAGIEGSTITALKFYSSNASVTFGNAVFKVYLKEVAADALASAFSGDADATTVYEGSLSISSNEMTITFSSEYEYQGGNLLVGTKVTTKGTYNRAYFYGDGTLDNVCSRYNSGSGNGSAQYFIPKTTITYEAAAEGAALKVKGYKDGDEFSFGMVNPGATKTLTLQNPGTETVNVTIATTGGFNAAPTSVSIDAKGEATVTVTAPEETATGTITFTPDAAGLEPITLNLSCTIKDPSKVWIDFSDNALPSGDETGVWETVGIGSYTTGSSASSYAWDFTKGYALYKSSTSAAGYLDYYYNSLVSPLMKFADGEKVIFKVKKETQYDSYLGYLRVDYTTDGSTWTTAATFANADLTTEWQEKEASMPASAKKIRFVAAGIALDDIYGGELSTEPVMAVTASDHAFGMVAEAASTTFTIANSGKSTLTGIEVVASDQNFTISDVPTSVEPGAEATVTVTMATEALGLHEGVITVSAPNQESASFTVNGYVMDTDLFTETFDATSTPEGWENTGWTFADGAAAGAYKSNKVQLITPSLTVEEGEKMALEVKKNRTTSCTLPIYVSKDGGDFTLLKTIANSELTDQYQIFFIEGLEAGSYKIRFDGDDCSITALNGFHIDMNAPLMEVSPTTAADFGKVYATPEAITYTVANTGTGTLTVNITSDSEDFTVSPATLEVTDEPQTFTVSFNYAEGNYGAKSGVITVTPTYNEEAAVTINATAKAMDPNSWDEDFEGGEIPTGWLATDFTVGTKSYTTNPNTTKVAYATGNSGSAVLVTPRLQANAGDVLTWEAYFDWSDEGIKVEYSNDDQETWTVVNIDGLTLGTATTGQLADAYVPKNNGFTNERGTKLDMSFTAPEDGYYYLRFTSSYNGNAVDNFNGLKLALKEHDAMISSSGFRDTFNQYSTYDVSVTVKELAGKEETLTAKFFVDGVQYGEDAVETVDANGEKEFTVSVTFDEVISGNAYFIVSNDNIELKSEEVAITVNPAVVLDETIAAEDLTTGWQDVVMIKYTAKKGWNTICMPFQMNDTDMEAIFGEGYKVYEFKSYNNGELGFVDANSRYYAGYPYVVYSENPVSYELGYKVIYVNFSTTTAKYDSYSGATFQGTFAPMAAGEMEGKYGVVPSTGRIQVGGPNATLKGFRGYFELPADAPASLSATFEDANGETTRIEGVELDELLNGDIYDLNGRKMNNARSLQPGVYVKDGKKIVVK